MLIIYFIYFIHKHINRVSKWMSVRNAILALVVRNGLTEEVVF